MQHAHNLEFLKEKISIFIGESTKKPCSYEELVIGFRNFT